MVESHFIFWNREDSDMIDHWSTLKQDILSFIFLRVIDFFILNQCFLPLSDNVVVQFFFDVLLRNSLKTGHERNSEKCSLSLGLASIDECLRDGLSHVNIKKCHFHKKFNFSVRFTVKCFHVSCLLLHY